jgi:hypothetical protein
MKKVLSGVMLLGVIAAPVLAVPTNQGPDRPLQGLGQHVISGDELGGGFRGLYAPSEADDAAWRANLGAATGGTWDYFDPRAATPTLSFLMDYDCVHVWANYAFLDRDAYGNVLADFVDAGGAVVMGAFTVYTSGNSLGGRVVTAAYCPVVGGFNNFFFASYAGDGGSCITDGVSTFGATYRDILSTQGAGVVDGTFTDGEVAIAYNAGFSPQVIYANGSGGFPIDGSGPDWPDVVGQACMCTGGGVPVEETSWGSLKGAF